MCRVNTEERTRAMEGFCLGGILCGQRRRHFFFLSKNQSFYCYVVRKKHQNFIFLRWLANLGN